MNKTFSPDTAIFCGYVLLILCFLLCSSGCKPAYHVVRQGKAEHAIQDFESWEQHPGYLEGRRTNNMLFAGAQLKGEAFRLRLLAGKAGWDGKPFSLQLGDARIGVDIRHKGASALCLTGPSLPDTLYAVLNPAALSSPWLNMRLKYRQGRLRFFARGKLYFDVETAPFQGRFGVWPGETTARVRRFFVRGALAPHEAPPDFTPIFRRGDGGYNTFRIPALLHTRGGHLLAFCEGRKNSRQDHGDIDLVMRRSRDGGQSWGPIQIVYEEGGYAPVSISSPGPVQDSSGRIHLLMTRNASRLLYSFSDDEGLNWSAPRDLTAAIRAVDWPWHRLCNSPGHITEIPEGPWRGRLLSAVWLHDTLGQRFISTVIFSDDGGRNWQAGGLVDTALTGSNEAMAVALPGGELLLSVRMQQKGQARRAWSRSHDGGLNWSPVYFDPALPDPVCQASALARPGGKLLFFNPADARRHHRLRMTLRQSPDAGASWPFAQPIHEGPGGYSDMALLPDGSLYLLFEAGLHFMYEGIVGLRVVLPD